MGDNLAGLPEKGLRAGQVSRAGGKRLGLIVNPVAGIGGRVGLKGSDGRAIQQQALELGAVPESPARARQALETIGAAENQLELITYPGEMGEDTARECGLEPTVIGAIERGATTAADTIGAAREMQRLGADLLLFAGGDGTARDVCKSVGAEVPALGIPAGVKIHSAVFATSPRTAGALAALFLAGRVTRLREAEVMDVDEEAYRGGRVSAKLYGYLRMPFRRRLVQGQKTASGRGEAASMQAIAAYVAEKMADDCLYVIGPGTTTRAITSRLGLEKTLIGVDVVSKAELVAADVNESQLLKLLEGHKARIIVTPIGGQGFIFGRGNQQISRRVIEEVGRENIMVVSTPEKIGYLAGRPLWVDTGDRSVDAMLAGHIRIVTGYNQQIIYKVSC